MANVPIHNLTDTWSDAGTEFTAIRMNVTDTASASGSKLMDLLLGGVSQLALTKAGDLTLAGSITAVGGNLTGTVSGDVTLTGHWNFPGVFNVRNYGAAGDGVTDDAAAIQSANDAAEAAGGGIVYYPPGIYRVNTQITINTSNVRHIGVGVNVSIIESNANNQACLTFQGARVTGESNTLASNSSSGDQSVSLAPGKGANFSPGNWALLLDEASIADTTQKQGEIVYVRSVSTDTITLAGPIRYNYTTGNTAQLQRLELLNGVGFSGLSMRKVTSGTSTGDLAAFLYCHAPFARDSELYQNAQAGLSFFGCVGANVDVWAHDLESDSASKFGYGVKEAGANVGAKIYVNAQRVRHAYTTINSSSVLPYGVPTATRVSGSAIDTFMSAWDTHEEAQGVVFDGCTVSGSGLSGFQIRGKGCEVLGGTAERCIGPGVFIPSRAADTVVDSVHLDLTNLGTDVDGVNWTDAGAIEDRGERTTIETPHIKDSGGPGINIHANARDPYIVNPRIIDPCRITITTKTGISNMAANTGTFTIHGGLISCSDTRMDYGVRCTNSGVDFHISGGTRVFGAQVARISRSSSHYEWGTENVTPLNLGPQIAYTISSGAIDISDGRSGNIAVNPETTGVADDLQTITGGANGDWISLRRDEGVTITIKHDTGNILTSTGADVTIDSSLDNFLMKKIGGSWIMLRVS